jgi:hypothetical protein
MKVAGQLHGPATLLPGKETPVPIGEYRESTEKSLAPTGNLLPADSPASGSSLYRLSYPGYPLKQRYLKIQSVPYSKHAVYQLWRSIG